MQQKWPSPTPVLRPSTWKMLHQFSYLWDPHLAVWIWLKPTTADLSPKGINKGLVTVSSCLHIKTPSVISSLLDVPTQIGTVSNSCTAGLDSIANAAEAIKSGKFKIAVAGGTDAGIIPSVVTGLGFAGLLSTHNDHPESASRPFDIMRTGGYLGEGSGVLILESLDHAIERNADIYAEILGYDTICDYSNMQRIGYEISMQNALTNSACKPEDISFISAHGSGSIELDEIETEAIKRLFGNHAYMIPVNIHQGSNRKPSCRRRSVSMHRNNAFFQT